MLTVFMDDSDMSGEGPVGILAGWMAPSAWWVDFARDWHDEVLNFGNNPLKVFKPTTRDLKDERELARLRAAMAVLVRYRPLGLIVAIPHAEHKGRLRQPSEEETPQSVLHGSVRHRADAG